MKRRQKRVLIALGWYDYRLHSGIEKYAQEHGWYLYANLAREKVIPWGWKGDGILAWLGAGDDLAEFVSSIKKPTVDFSLRRAHLPFARMLEDHAHAAQLVAEHFHGRGFKHFAFYCDSPNWSFEERGEGFVKALKCMGHECQWLRWHESEAFGAGRDEWQRKRAWLAAELKQAPKPLAVFAANDEQALDVLETCEELGIVVPDQVAIVGAENFLLAPDTMHTPISSVDTNLHLLGYQGAALLDGLMSGEPAPAKPVRVPAARLVVRKSSDILAVKHPGVLKSLRFIWDHGHEPISVKDVVGVSGMSRRGLHKAFLDQIDRTPGQEIHRLRIDNAKRLLVSSDEKIETLAELCGYQSANSLCVAFKNTTGLSPKQFRDTMRPGFKTSDRAAAKRKTAVARPK
jgi:LacI family transcriptional regulator